MDSLSIGPIAETLTRLFRAAEEADGDLTASLTNNPDIEQTISHIVQAETRDLYGTYHSLADRYLNVSREFGHFVYLCARTRRAARIVEFGTSMGISTIHLAAALRDNGGGELIGTEIEPSKVAKARVNLEAAGLADLVQIRQGDARETLVDLTGGIDLVLLDGAFSLYLPVLKLIEPCLTAGALILAENAFEGAGGYLEYVRDPANGYLSMPLPVNPGRGNEFSVLVR